jgi:2-acylglycerol O-acyltransferase 2
MIQDVIGSIYLLWPLTAGAFLFFFLAGFLFAISLGGFIAIGCLVTYYTFVYLKKKGVFQQIYDWLLSKNKLVSERLTSHIHDTFLLKGHLDKLPEGPVLYVAHPHGLFSMAPFLHWAAEKTSWPSGKKVHIAIHSIFFRIPLVRELCEHFGAIEANDEDIREVLRSGDSVALLTGGVREIFSTEAGQMKIHLKKRRGFARVAKDLGVPIVPVLTFGENELFPPIEGFWTDWVQQYLRKWFGISIPVPTFESLKNWFSLLRNPLTPPVVTWIGRPIIPKEKTSIDTLRKQVFRGFEVLYHEGRPEHYSPVLLIL